MKRYFEIFDYFEIINNFETNKYFIHQRHTTDNSKIFFISITVELIYTVHWL